MDEVPSDRFNADSAHVLDIEDLPNSHKVADLFNSAHDCDRPSLLAFLFLDSLGKAVVGIFVGPFPRTVVFQQTVRIPKEMSTKNHEMLILARYYSHVQRHVGMF